MGRKVTMESKENYLPDYLTIPCVLVKDKRLQHLDHLVYGIIYWFGKLTLGKCIASNKFIAELIQSKRGSVANSVSRLSKYGYVRVLYDPTTRGKNKVRTEIIPLIVFTDPSSKNDTPLHQKMNTPSSTDDTPLSSKNEENNKNIEKEYIKSTTADDSSSNVREPKENPAPYSNSLQAKTPTNRLFKYLSEFSAEDANWIKDQLPGTTDEFIWNQVNRAIEWTKTHWVQSKNTKSPKETMKNWIERAFKSQQIIKPRGGGVRVQQ